RRNQLVVVTLEIKVVELVGGKSLPFQQVDAYIVAPFALGEAAGTDAAHVRGDVGCDALHGQAQFGRFDDDGLDVDLRHAGTVIGVDIGDEWTVGHAFLERLRVFGDLFPIRPLHSQINGVTAHGGEALRRKIEHDGAHAGDLGALLANHGD